MEASLNMLLGDQISNIVLLVITHATFLLYAVDKGSGREREEKRRVFNYLRTSGV